MMIKSKSKPGVRCMSRDQFRNIMGLLGQNKDPFLTDRIFDIFDDDQDESLTFEKFTHIMDILCNGSEDERNQFSFRLMDT